MTKRLVDSLCLVCLVSLVAFVPAAPAPSEARSKHAPELVFDLLPRGPEQPAHTIIDSWPDVDPMKGILSLPDSLLLRPSKGSKRIQIRVMTALPASSLEIFVVHEVPIVRWLRLKQKASRLESSWDLRDSTGSRVPSGLYMVVARTRRGNSALVGGNGYVLVP